MRSPMGLLGFHRTCGLLEAYPPAPAQQPRRRPPRPGAQETIDHAVTITQTAGASRGPLATGRYRR